MKFINAEEEFGSAHFAKLTEIKKTLIKEGLSPQRISEMETQELLLTVRLREEIQRCLSERTKADGGCGESLYRYTRILSNVVTSGNRQILSRRTELSLDELERVLSVVNDRIRSALEKDRITQKDAGIMKELDDMFYAIGSGCMKHYFMHAELPAGYTEFLKLRGELCEASIGVSSTPIVDNDLFVELDRNLPDGKALEKGDLEACYKEEMRRWRQGVCAETTESRGDRRNRGTKQ